MFDATYVILYLPLLSFKHEVFAKCNKCTRCYDSHLVLKSDAIVVVFPFENCFLCVFKHKPLSFVTNHYKKYICKQRCSGSKQLSS